MPIYDYVCGSCRHLIEVVHGINEPGPRFCPACGADGSMRKALSKPAIHFKGSGWAKKDRSSSSSARSGSKREAAGDGAAGDTAGTPAAVPAPGDGAAPPAGGGPAAGGDG